MEENHTKRDWTEDFNISLREAMEQLKRQAEMASKTHQIMNYPGSHAASTTIAGMMDEAKATVAPKLQHALDDALIYVIARLCKLTRVTLSLEDVDVDCKLSEEKITFVLKPKNRYSKLVFEELKEMLISEELQKG